MKEYTDYDTDLVVAGDSSTVGVEGHDEWVVVDSVTEKQKMDNIRACLIWMNSLSEEEKPPED